MNNKNPNVRLKRSKRKYTKGREEIASCIHASPTFTLFIEAAKQKRFLLLVTLECCNNRDRNKDNTSHLQSSYVL